MENPSTGRYEVYYLENSRDPQVGKERSTRRRGGAWNSIQKEEKRE